MYIRHLAPDPVTQPGWKKKRRKKKEPSSKIVYITNGLQISVFAHLFYLAKQELIESSQIAGDLRERRVFSSPAVVWLRSRAVKSNDSLFNQTKPSSLTGRAFCVNLCSNLFRFYVINNRHGLFIYISVCVCVCVRTHMCVCTNICISISLPTYPSVFSSVRQSVCLSACLSVCHDAINKVLDIES